MQVKYKINDNRAQIPIFYMKSLNQYLKALKNIIQLTNTHGPYYRKRDILIKLRQGCPEKMGIKLCATTKPTLLSIIKEFFNPFHHNTQIEVNTAQCRTVAVLLNSFPEKNHSTRTGSTHSKQEVRSNKPYISEVKKKCKRRIYSWKIHRHDAPLKR